MPVQHGSAVGEWRSSRVPSGDPLEDRVGSLTKPDVDRVGRPGKRPPLRSGHATRYRSSAQSPVTGPAFRHRLNTGCSLAQLAAAAPSATDLRSLAPADLRGEEEAPSPLLAMVASGRIPWILLPVRRGIVRAQDAQLGAITVDLDDPRRAPSPSMSRKQTDERGRCHRRPRPGTSGSRLKAPSIVRTDVV